MNQDQSIERSLEELFASSVDLSSASLDREGLPSFYCLGRQGRDVLAYLMRHNLLGDMRRLSRTIFYIAFLGQDPEHKWQTALAMKRFEPVFPEVFRTPLTEIGKYREELQELTDRLRAPSPETGDFREFIDGSLKYVVATYIINASLLESMLLFGGDPEQAVDLAGTASANRFEKDVYLMSGAEVPDEIARQPDGADYFRICLKGELVKDFSESEEMHEPEKVESDEYSPALPHFIRLGTLKRCMAVVDNTRACALRVVSSSRAAVEASLGGIPWQEPEVYRDSLRELGDAVEALEIISASSPSKIPALESAVKAVKDEAPWGHDKRRRIVEDALPEVEGLLPILDELKSAISAGIGHLSKGSSRKKERIDNSGVRDRIVALHYHMYAEAESSDQAGDSRGFGIDLMKRIPAKDRPWVMSRVMSFYADEDASEEVLMRALQAMAEDSLLPMEVVEEPVEIPAAVEAPAPAVDELTVEERRRRELGVLGIEGAADVVEGWIPHIFTCSDRKFCAEFDRMKGRSLELADAVRDVGKDEVSAAGLVDRNPDLFFTGKDRDFAEYVRNLAKFGAVRREVVSGQREYAPEVWAQMDLDMKVLSNPDALRLRLGQIGTYLSEIPEVPDEAAAPAEPGSRVHGREAIFNDAERAGLIDRLNRSGLREFGDEGGDAAYKILTRGFIAGGRLYTGANALPLSHVRKNSGVEDHHVFDRVFDFLLREGAVAPAKSDRKTFILTADTPHLREPYRTIIKRVVDNI